MAEHATRTVTFLLTDIEGSTRLWEEYREAMAVALEAHDSILKAAVERAGGTVVQTTGDGLLAEFDQAEAAVTAALDGQHALDGYEWPATGPLRVRMAIHSGSAQVRDEEFHGRPLNRVARLLAIGYGGQVLLSGATVALVADSLPPRLELIDRGEHHLRDLDRPEHVYQLAGPGLRREFPALRSTAAHPSNLPNQLTSFVGREQELGDVRALVVRSRLVTLVGVGGTGKTRLMLKAASAMVDRYRDGVWLVELAPVSDPGLVVQEVAHAIGIQEQPGQRLIDTAVDFLRASELLLVLDNCEHVIAAAADLAQRLLGDCPSLTVLASSREPLGVGGEAILAVPSLALPPAIDARETGLPIDPGLLDRAAGAEAVRLFVERAVETLPSFTLDAANVSAVIEICRRLDGIPLALELAAARVNVLSVQEIAQGLGDRFRLLTGGRRTAVPRQQTLQALIDWSWDLLSDADRRLLRRLSIFAGGWTLEAAAAVTSEGIAEGDAAHPNAAAGDARLDTLDGLSRLVDRSLVVVLHEAGTRYGMLETIRQYARNQLVLSDEVADLAAAHLAYFRKLALEAGPALHGRDMVAWLDRLDTESDNLRSALDWAFEADKEAALELCVSLVDYWTTRSVGSESIDWLERAVDVARVSAADTASPSWRSRSILAARTLAAAAVTSALWASGEPAFRWAEEGLAIARQTGDPRALSNALSSVALASVFAGRAWSPRELLEELVPLLEELEDWWQLALMEGGLAIGLRAWDPAEADARLIRATAAARRSENPAAIAFTAKARGRVAADAGRLEEARGWLTEAIDRYREIGDRRQVLASRSDLVHAMRRWGSLDEAEAAYRETIQEWRRSGNRGAIANQLEAFAFVAVARKDGGRAARLLGAAEALREASGSPLLAVERPEYDEQVGRLREMLDDSSLRSAWAQGRQMTMEDAVAFAVSD